MTTLPMTKWWEKDAIVGDTGGEWWKSDRIVGDTDTPAAFYQGAGSRQITVGGRGPTAQVRRAEQQAFDQPASQAEVDAILAGKTPSKGMLNPIGAVGEVLPSVPFAGSVFSIDQALRVRDAAKRVEVGKGRSTDWMLLKEFTDKQREYQASPWYSKAFQIVRQLPAFAGEIAMTGGAFTYGKQAVQKTVEKGLTRIAGEGAERAALTAANRGITGAATKVAGTAAGAATQLAALPQYAIQPLIQNLTPQLQTDAKDKLVGVLEDSADDFGPAMGKALGEGWIQLVSERTGGAVQIPGLKAAILQRWLRLHPNQTVVDALEKVASKTGWHGVTGEIFEERVAEVLRPALGVTKDYEPPTWEQLKAEAAAFSVPTAASTALQVGTAHIERRAEKKSEDREAADIALRAVTPYEPSGAKSEGAMAADLLRRNPQAAKAIALQSTPSRSAIRAAGIEQRFSARERREFADSIRRELAQAAQRRKSAEIPGVSLAATDLSGDFKIPDPGPRQEATAVADPGPRNAGDNLSQVTTDPAPRPPTMPATGAETPSTIGTAEGANVAQQAPAQTVLEQTKSKTRFTSIPREWFNVGPLFNFRGTEALRKGERAIGARGRPVRAFPASFRDQFDSVPKDATRLLDAIRAQTREVIEVQGTRGGYYLVPKGLVEPAQAALPDWQRDVDEANERRQTKRAAREEKRSAKAAAEFEKAEAERKQAEVARIRAMTTKDWNALADSNPDEAERLALKAERYNIAPPHEDEATNGAQVVSGNQGAGVERGSERQGREDRSGEALGKPGAGEFPGDFPGRDKSLDFLASPGASPQSPSRIKTAKIAVAPLTGGQPKLIRDIIIDLEKGVGEVRTAKPHGRSLGTYYPGSARTVIRFDNDADTAAHEIAHRLDDVFGIVAEWSTPRGYDKRGRPLPQTSPFDDELRQPIFQQTIRRHYSVVQKRAEGVAEFTRALVLNPDEAVKLAPKFAVWFEKQVPAEVRQRLRAFGDDIRRWAGQSSAERTGANIEMKLRPESLAQKMKQGLSSKGEGFSINWLDQVKAAALDSLSPLWKAWAFTLQIRGIEKVLPSKDLRTLVRNFAGFDRKLDAVLEHGPIDAKNRRIKGIGGIDWLLEPLDHSSKRALEEDMAATVSLMVSQRIIERAQLLETSATAIENAVIEIDALRALLVNETDPQIRAQIADDMGAKMAIVVQHKKSMGFKGDAFNPQKVWRWVEERKQRLAGTGAGIYSDHAQAVEAAQDFARDPARYAKLQEAATRYRDWAGAVLRYARDKGRISGEQYDNITKRNKQYVALQRLFDTVDPRLQAMTSASRRIGSVKPVVFTFRGSTRTIQNPYVSLIMQTHGIMRESDRNEALRTFRNALNVARSMYEGDVLDLDQIGSRAKAGDEDTTRIFVNNGEAEYWQFESNIHAALRNWGITEPRNIVFDMLAFLPRLAHDSITHSPMFIIRNVLRDPLFRSTVTRTGSKPWSHLYFATPKGVSTFDDDLADFHLFGGGLFGFYRHGKKDYYQRLDQHVKQLADDKSSIITIPAMLGRGYLKIARGSETIGRLAEYRTALKHAKDKLGYDDFDAGLYAAFQARDLTDYAVAGSAVRSLSRFVIFLNAAIQGTARTIKGAQENPKRFAARWMVYVLSLELGCYLWNWMMGDDEERRQQPDYLRDYFWSFKLGPDLWLRIPGPWELKVLGSGVSRGIDAARGKPNAFDGWADSIWKSASPVDSGAMLGPFRTIGEAMTNHDLFRDRPIVPPWEKDLDLRLRKGTKDASRIGQLIQDAVGMDARKVDHLVRGTFGGLGEIALDLSDTGREDKPGMTRALMAASGVLTRSPASAAQDVQYVFDHAARNGQLNANSLKSLRTMLDQYHEAESATDRDRLAARIRIRAGALRRAIDRNGKLPGTQGRASGND